MKRRLQASSPPAQQPHGHADVSDQPVHFLSHEAARFLRFDRKSNGQTRTPRDTMRLFREWAKRHHVPTRHRGRTLLYERRVLVAFLDGARWTRTHVEQSGPVLVGRQR